MLLATLYIALCFRKIEFPSSLYCVCKPNISFSIIPWLFGELHSVLSSRETQFWQLFIFSTPRRIAYFSCLLTVQFAPYTKVFFILNTTEQFEMFLLVGKIISGAEKLGACNHFHVSYRNDSLHLNEFLRQKRVSNTQIGKIINQQKTFYN